MTSNNAARLSAIQTPEEAVPGPAGPASPADPVEVLERLRDTALSLLAGLDQAPSSLRIKADDVEITMDWPVAGATGVAPVPAPAAGVEPAGPAAGAETDRGHYVTAHMVGVFYRASEPGAPPFVEPGDQVTAGQQIGIIEAMKLMIPIEADVDGRVVEVLAGNGEPVEFGDRLFELEPAGDAG